MPYFVNEVRMGIPFQVELLTILRSYRAIRPAEPLLDRNQFASVITFDGMADELKGISAQKENRSPEPHPQRKEIENERAQCQHGKRNSDEMQQIVRAVLMSKQPSVEPVIRRSMGGGGLWIDANSRHFVRSGERKSML